MSIVQACFSLGGTVAPFISTAFAQHVRAAYRYFFVAMAVALLTVVIMLFAFEGKTEEQLTSLLPQDRDKEKEKAEEVEMAAATHAASPAPAEEREKAHPHEHTHDPTLVPNDSAPLPPADTETLYAPDSSGTKMLRIFSTPSVYALIIWAFLYVSSTVRAS